MLKERLQNRLNEMILRRKKLLKSLCKKEALASNPSSKDALSAVPKMIEEREIQKSTLLENFTVGYLEEMLKSTTKSIARDVVNTLIPPEQAGALLVIEKMYGSQPKEQPSEQNEDVKSSQEMQNMGSNDEENPYSGDDTGVVQAMNPSVKLPPSSVKQKQGMKDSSSGSLKSSIKNRSNSSRPNSKGL